MNRKSRNIVISSVLKPVDDVRLLEKFALTINDLEDSKIHIIAHKSISTPQAHNIHFHPVFNFTRLSWKRFITSFIFLKALLKIQPDDIIVATHELLWPSLLYKLFAKVNLYYDVQENYVFNISKTNTFPPLIKTLLAVFVRMHEKMAAPFITHFFLAERCYALELPFISNRYSIIENKFKGGINKESKPISGTIRFIYTGTIGENYGTLQAIQFVKKLYQFEPNILLTVIGFCSKRSYLDKIKAEITDCPYIQLIGGDILVPHTLIIEALNKADAALLPYLPSPSTNKCIPTKLYECIALKIPMIIPENPLWISILNEYHGGIVVDFNHFNVRQIIDSLKTEKFYTKGDFSNVLWKSEAEKLKNALNHGLMIYIMSFQLLQL